MAKKIIITFNSEPTPTTAFVYAITINGVNLVYPGGFSEVNFAYQDFGGTDPSKCEIQNNFSLTINETLAFLTAHYSNPIITYARVNDTIEVSINTDSETVLVYIGAVNPNLTLNTTDIQDISFVHLKYYFQYKNIVNDTYLCEIFKKGYEGDSQEIHGKIIIEKASVNNLLDPIRGGGVQLQLEATKDLTLEDLYSEGENEFSVKVYKNNKLIFYGYLNPDGVYQDYVRDEWRITMDCTDGLGALSNLSFVKDNGFHFTGKMKAIDIIHYCLKRTGILIPINTSVNTLYNDYIEGSDIFNKIYLNANRFKKTDDDTIMSCEEVLKSILDIFKACITQQDGEWYIFKPNELYLDAYATFRRFDITNNYVGNKKVNLNKVLGSQIDNFYPHHCTGNQRTEIKGSVSSFRLGYKYGLVSGLMTNPGLVKNGNILDYDGWTVIDVNSHLINDPLKTSGFYIKKETAFGTTNVIVQSDSIPVTIDDDLTLKLDYEAELDGPSWFVKFKIRHGSYYLNYTPKNSSTPIEDTINAVWSTNPASTFVFWLVGGKGTVNIQLPKILADAGLTVSIIAAASTTYIKSLDVLPTPSTGSPEGEFHTVSRANRVSSIVKPNQTVFNGDNVGSIYLGAIYDEFLNPTSLWSRKNSADKFPLLRIAAEEELRIAQRPTKKFIGDFYGYIPYLSVIAINNIGTFMPIEWSYDTTTNVTVCKQLELFVAELIDIDYVKGIDYGETVKPTIK